MAKGVDKMSPSSPVALLNSTCDMFHILADSAHEMTLPCSKERQEASDATSLSAKTRFQICAKKRGIDYGKQDFSLPCRVL